MKAIIVMKPKLFCWQNELTAMQWIFKWSGLTFNRDSELRILWLANVHVRRLRFRDEWRRGGCMEVRRVTFVPFLWRFLPPSDDCPAYIWRGVNSKGTIKLCTKLSPDVDINSPNYWRLFSVVHKLRISRGNDSSWNDNPYVLCWWRT